MTTITQAVTINVPAAVVWDAVRDFGALDRLVPGFVVATEVEPGDPPVRVVTFANGLVLREVIVEIDDLTRRFVWAIENAEVRHHNGALTIADNEPGRCQVTWTADVLPAVVAEQFEPLMTTGLAVMRDHLESAI